MKKLLLTLVLMIIAVVAIVMSRSDVSDQTLYRFHNDPITVEVVKSADFPYNWCRVIGWPGFSNQIDIIPYPGGITAYYYDNLDRWVEVYKRNDGKNIILIDNCAVTGDAQIALLEGVEKYIKNS